MQSIEEFQQAVWRYYRAHARPMPWRASPTPYRVMVSEIMLQQTQVTRVVPKFTSFIERFPALGHLAAAPLGEVLQEWSGLGYNRRAKYVHAAAQAIMAHHHGEVPSDLSALQALPGIGTNTAGAIAAYAFNQPAVFIETNIRTVYLHHFFADATRPIADVELRQLVACSLDMRNPREWYWALMDYGTHLKAAHGSRLTHSQAYRPQSTFKGSRRQVRGQVLRLLAAQPRLPEVELLAAIADDRLARIINELAVEGLLQREQGIIYLTGY